MSLCGGSKYNIAMHYCDVAVAAAVVVLFVLYVAVDVAVVLVVLVVTDMVVI